MDHLTRRVLHGSGDAVAIVRAADGVVIDANDAFSTTLGYARSELVGRPYRELFVRIEGFDGPMTLGWEGAGSVSDVPVGLRTRSGKLRVGTLSALAVDLGGSPTALCTVRDLREPVAVERRLAVRDRLGYVLEGDGPWPEAAASALRAFGEFLGWELGTLWLVDPGAASPRCGVVWHARPPGGRQVDAAGAELVGRTWRSRQPTWIPDVATASGIPPPGTAAAWVHAWHGFPVWLAGDVVGVVELCSGEVRQPDRDLLELAQESGELLGRLVADAGAHARFGNAARSGPSVPGAGPEAPGPQAITDILRDLASAVSAIADVLEAHPALLSRARLPEVWEALAATVGRLRRLLESAGEPGGRLAIGAELAAPPPPARQPQPPLPTGLTLKAVSRRTGIPAATLRTWERRYGFIRPARSDRGYRLYGEEEVARILQVKYLHEQGVRIGQAMAAVARPPERPGTTVE
jgi:PAS domain S-box-containing protein